MGRVRSISLGNLLLPDTHAIILKIEGIKAHRIDDCIGLGPNCEYFRIGSFFVGAVFFFFDRRGSAPGAGFFLFNPLAALLAIVSGACSLRSSPRFPSI